jgi:hypothetical protein
MVEDARDTSPLNHCVADQWFPSERRVEEDVWSDEEIVIGEVPMAVNDVQEVEPEQDTDVVATEPRVAG